MIVTEEDKTYLKLAFGIDVDVDDTLSIPSILESKHYARGKQAAIFEEYYRRVNNNTWAADSLSLIYKAVVIEFLLKEKHEDI